MPRSSPFFLIGSRAIYLLPSHAVTLLTPPRDGQFASETRPDGNVAAITYDTRGFPTVVDWSSNTQTPDVTLGFDNAGRLTSAGNGGTTVTRAYDGSGRLSTESSQINWPGLRVEATPLTLTYTYDTDSRPAAVAGPAGHTTGYTYNTK